MGNKDIDGCERSQLIGNYKTLKDIQRSLSAIQHHDNASMLYTVTPTTTTHYLKQSIINIHAALEIMRSESTTDELVKEILADIEGEYNI